MRKLQGLRKIRNGEVKFFGKTYVPRDFHFPYNGELDGETWFFMGYQPAVDMLALWGDKQRYLSSRSDESYDRDCERRESNVTEEGFIRWYFWKPKETL